MSWGGWGVECEWGGAGARGGSGGGVCDGSVQAKARNYFSSEMRACVRMRVRVCACASVFVRVHIGEDDR